MVGINEKNFWLFVVAGVIVAISLFLFLSKPRTILKKVLSFCAMGTGLLSALVLGLFFILAKNGSQTEKTLTSVEVEEAYESGLLSEELYRSHKNGQDIVLRCNEEYCWLYDIQSYQTK